MGWVFKWLNSEYFSDLLSTLTALLDKGKLEIF